MSHIRGLTELGFVVNPPFLDPWPLKIGQYLLNCSAIEMYSYQYLNALEATRDDFNRSLDKLLSKRVERIQYLVKQSSTIPKLLKDEIASLWSEVIDLSQW